MPTKQFQLLKATASIKPEVKKQIIITAPIHAMSSSCMAYLAPIWTASSPRRRGDDSILSLREGLGLLEAVGVLFNVGAVEVNFSRSMLDMDRATLVWLSRSTKATAGGIMAVGCFIWLNGIFGKGGKVEWVRKARLDNDVLSDRCHCDCDHKLTQGRNGFD